MSRPSIREIGILIILALAPCVVLGHMTAELAPRFKDNQLTFVTSNSTWHDYLALRQEWRPRVLSNLSAHVCSRIARVSTESPELWLRRTVALHSAGWLLLINLVLILGFGRGAIPFIWGVFAAAAFGYASGVDERVYPWDLPGMFVFASFVVAHARGWDRTVPFLIAGGAMFKETTIVLAVTPLFLDLPWRDRFKRSALSLLLFGIVRIAVDILVKSPIPFISMSTRLPGRSSFRVMSNLRSVLQPRIAGPIMINAGTLAAFLLLPNKNATTVTFKCVAAIFALGLMVFGRILEYRIWFEMAPLGIFALLRHFEEHPPTNQGMRAADLR